jgi:hypothetical protein
VVGTAASNRSRGCGGPEHTRDWLVIAALVLGAFAIRAYRLDAFPDTLLADEADNAQAAVRILYGQPPEGGIFGLDWTGQPALSIYKEALSIRLLGFTVLALRLPSALIGALAIAPFYLLLRRQYSVVASSLAAVLLATEVWYLNFSRSGWNCIDVCFYMLGAMYFLLSALDRLNRGERTAWATWRAFAFAGLFCALGLHAYPSGRTITVALLLFLPLACWFHRRQTRYLLIGYGLLVGVEGLASAPEAWHVARHWDAFTGRTRVVSIFNSERYRADPAGTMLRQIGRNLRGPWDGTVNNTAQYSPVHEPQLGRVTGILVLFGMALSVALARIRRQPETCLWWLMLFSGWAFTQLLTVETPNGARGIVYVPALVAFAAPCLDELMSLLRRSGLEATGDRRFADPSDRSPVHSRRAAGAVTVAIAAAALANVHHYVSWQQMPHTRLERYLYVTVGEFRDWSNAIVDRARAGAPTMNVGQWRDAHPVADWGYPVP